MRALATPASAVNPIRKDTSGERDLVLSTLDVAATRSRLQTNIFESIGVALQSKQIDYASVLTWLEEEGLLHCLPFGPGARAMNAPRPCNTCGYTPCDSRGFCRSCRQADRKQAKQRHDRRHPDRGLPPNCDSMSAGELWAALNRPDRYATPRSTIDAIVRSVKARGAEALKEPANLDRLDCCDESAKAQINARLVKMGLRYE
jgi:hypothetical protein